MKFSVLTIIVLLLFICLFTVLPSPPAKKSSQNDLLLLSQLSMTLTTKSPRNDKDLQSEIEIVDGRANNRQEENSNNKKSENGDVENEQKLDDWKKTEYLWRLASHVSEKRREPFESTHPFEKAKDLESEDSTSLEKQKRNSRFVLS